MCRCCTRVAQATGRSASLDNDQCVDLAEISIVSVQTKKESRAAVPPRSHKLNRSKNL